MARLVICDDETHITDILTRFFREKGHEVFGTTQGEHALEKVLERATDLVITDIAMKGISGFDLLRRIKEAGVETPVIITTGNPSHTSAVQALREGAFDYVVKPFHLEEILERTERALMNKRIREENLLYSKLVSLHSVTKMLSEAATLDALCAKVVQMGSRLTQCEGGWYWALSPALGAGASGGSAVHSLRPNTDDRELKLFLLRIAQANMEKADVLVTDTAADLSGEPSWFLSLPVKTGSAVHGILIFRRFQARGRYDAVDLEIFNQLASTMALNIRALGLASRPTAAPSGNAAAPARPAAGEGHAAWARLVGRLVDEHCPGYASKGRRVVDLGRDLMRELGWPEEAGEDWELAGRVYDLAKLKVPQRILEKRKPLTEKEREIIQSLAGWAGEMLAAMPGLAGVARSVADWQERFDGMGRPRGAKGPEIAAQARLLGVADAFVAMLSDRPYRPSLGEAEALELVKAEAGSRFDPEIVAALARLRGA